MEEDEWVDKDRILMRESKREEGREERQDSSAAIGETAGSPSDGRVSDVQGSNERYHPRNFGPGPTVRYLGDCEGAAVPAQQREILRELHGKAAEEPDA